MKYLAGAAVLLFATAAAMGQEPSAGGELPDAHLPQPPPIWFTFDDYPRDAVVQRMEGGVRYRLTLDTNGRVTDCTILQSSGHTLLDDETCAILRRRAKLEPPKDASGSGEISQYIGTTRWLLPPGPVTPSERHTVWIEIKNGKPACSVDWNDGKRDLKPSICRDFRSHLPATSLFPMTLQVSGRPDEFGFKN